MLKRSHALLTLALAVPLTPAALRGQSETGPVAPRFTVGGGFGGLTGATKLDAAGTADWRTGWAASLDGTYWLRRLWGVRAGATFGQDSVRGAKPAAGSSTRSPTTPTSCCAIRSPALRPP